ncbi:multiple sugar transport system permease protein [Hypnocyclicus thermotrophus]|uniref:Multiple sugar transport system permease protein n=1 Tax=Hypnocyclicus thermotrophus TaxID=1627895 RepID=A0AA46DXM9_9FUSO|nr:sugar ABC transporter permease [Hypnocyclicus thermotrophus]TDT67940.1 multiple sugar transport system permease protein [Hypnocyclicus thermotrophus]
MKGFFKNKENYGYLFILPFFITFLIFSLFPILYTFFLSFNYYDGLSDMEFAGLAHYKRLITDPFFWTSLYNTCKIWFWNIIPQIGVALFLAGLFTLNKVKGEGFFKAVFYFPNLVTAASIALLFNVLLDWQHGPINQILIALHFIKDPINFLNIPSYAQNTVSLIQWWMWFGQTTIILLAGMSAIPETYYEAARVDGATKMQIFFKITLPLLKPTMLYVSVTSLIGGMQLFDVPAVLTDGIGAPQNSLMTMIIFLYNQAFRYENFGYASAVAYGIFAIISVLSFIIFKYMKNDK